MPPARPLPRRRGRRDRMAHDQRALPSERLGFWSLGETWNRFEASLRSRLEAQHDLTTVTPYLYEVHDLDQIMPIVAAASDDATSHVARTFFEHLARHWSWLASFADCQVALVERGKWPSQRSKPQRALAEELANGGDNLWVHRLSSRSICPTRLAHVLPHSRGGRPPSSSADSADAADRPPRCCRR